MSDSRRFWREDVEQIICSEEYQRLHILTHAFWYNVEDVNMKDTLQKFLIDTPGKYYGRLDENFRDLDSVLTLADVYRAVGKRGKEEGYV